MEKETIKTQTIKKIDFICKEQNFDEATICIQTNTHGWVTIGDMIGQAMDYLNKNLFGNGTLCFTQGRYQSIHDIPDYELVSLIEGRIVGFGSFVGRSDDMLTGIVQFGIDAQIHDDGCRGLQIFGFDFGEVTHLKSISDADAFGRYIENMDEMV